MVNPQRGDVAIRVDGQTHVMRLTLGALASLEARIGAGGLVELAERFEGGGFSGADLIALLTAGLNGGGADVSEEDVSKMDFDGGAIAAVEAAGKLLSRAFRGAA